MLLTGQLTSTCCGSGLVLGNYSCYCGQGCLGALLSGMQTPDPVLSLETTRPREFRRLVLPLVQLAPVCFIVQWHSCRSPSCLYSLPIARTPCACSHSCSKSAPVLVLISGINSTIIIIAVNIFIVFICHYYCACAEAWGGD